MTSHYRIRVPHLAHPETLDLYVTDTDARRHVTLWDGHSSLSPVHIADTRYTATTLDGIRLTITLDDDARPTVTVIPVVVTSGVGRGPVELAVTRVTEVA